MRELPPALRVGLAAAAVGLVGTGIVSLQCRSDLRRARAETARRLGGLADEQSVMAADWVEDVRVDLRMCLGFARASGEELSAYRTLLRREDYLWIQYVDRAGRRKGAAFREGGAKPLPEAGDVAAALRGPQGTVEFRRDLAGSRPVVDVGIADRDDGAAGGAIFARADPRVALFRELRSARAFSASAESLLVRREGDRVAFVSDLRGDGAPRRLPLSTPRLAAAKALRGEGFDGTEVDYRGRRVVSVARPIRGTDWMLIAKVDDAEVAGPALRAALWRWLFGICLLAIGSIGGALFLRRQETRHARRELAAHLELLAKSQELDAFFSHSLTPVVFLDPEFNFIRVNEAYAKACARKAEDFPGHNHFEFYPHAENEGIFRQVARTKTPYRALAKPFEFPDHPEWGRTYWDWTLVPILDAAGAVEFLVFSLEDVTERVRAEQEVRAKAAELEDMYDKAPCGYHSLGEDGTFLRVNDTELEWLGYRREEIVGIKKFPDLVTPAGVKVFRDEFPAFKERGWVRDLEFDMVRKDGSLLPTLVSAVAVKDDRGRYVMSRSTVYDNTDRKRAQEAQGRLAAMVESSDDAIVGAALDGIITSWNEGARRLYGWTAEEIVGESVLALAAPGRQEELPRVLARIRAGDHVAQMETRHRRRDGGLVHVSLTVSPIKDASGAVVGLSSVARDVSKRWEAEQAVARLTRMLRTLSLCNEALVRASDERELLERVCRLVIEQGGYRCAWVGYRTDDAARSVRPVAQAGYEAGYLEGLGITWADVERGRGPTGTAVREGGVQVCRDFSKDPRVAPWREEALKRGYRSSIALPLRWNGDVFGALTIYAPEVDAFKDPEVRLLLELSEDLAFGISALRTRAARDAAEKALRLASAYNRSLIEASLDPLVTIGPDGRITDVNRATEGATGLPRERLIGTDFSIYFTEPEKAKAGYERVFREGAVRDYRLEIRGRDGRVVPVLYNASVYRDEGGKIIGVFAAARDVSELERAEREREQFHRFFQTASDLMCMADPQGAFKKTNPAFTEVLGYSEAELIAKPFVDFIALEDKQRTIDEMADQMRRGYSLDFENRYLCKDGSVKWLSWRAIYDKSEGVTYATARDVTEQKGAEEALKRSETRFRRLFEAATDGIIIVDAASGRVLDANGAILRLLGCGREDWAGKPLWETEPFRRAAEGQPGLRELAARGVTRFEDLVLNAKDGRVVVVDFVASAYDSDGGTVVQCSVRDVSERRRLQAQVVHAQKMESVGVLAGGVAHDFNNILMTILANCAFVLSSLGPNDPRRADVEEIKAAGERAAALTRQLLIFSRKQPAQPVVLDLNGLVRNLGRMLGRLLGEDVKLAFELAEEPISVRADPGQLEQVIVNLAVNARDAMPRGGRLTLRTGRVPPGEKCHRDCTTYGTGRCVRLEIEDTGSGMAPEVLAHLFEPFFTTKPVGKGTGLGLSTVYGIVRQAGGGIGVRSEAGKGAAFAIDLPLAEAVAGAAEAPETPAETPPEKRERETIVLVEDDEVLRRIDLRVLQERGYRVLPARDGEEALDLLKGDGASADLLLTDVVMPGIGGWELAREALKIRPDLKVIFVSGYVEHRALEQIQAGKHEFLQKPVEPDVLARKVREVLDRKPAAAA